MNKPSILVSFDRTARSIFGSMIALALLLAPQVAAAGDQLAVHAGAGAAPAPRSHWSFNATPVLVFPTGGYRWGGGADPEVKYTLDLGLARVSVGARVGAYYARNQFGTSAMPTLRLMVPVGRIEPYVAAGVGYGWLPAAEHADFATMARAGFLYRFSKKVAIGVESTLQQIRGSNFRFNSIGSMMAFDL
jgi:hypothetical protein